MQHRYDLGEYEIILDEAENGWTQVYLKNSAEQIFIGAERIDIIRKKIKDAVSADAHLWKTAITFSETHTTVYVTTDGPVALLKFQDKNGSMFLELKTTTNSILALLC